MPHQELDFEYIKRIDKSGLLDLLLNFPLQCAAAKDIADKAKIKFKKKDFQQVVFAGMGGSGIGADLVRSYLYFECGIPIVVCREYDLPGYVGSSTLVFLLSYSGNTEEVISAYKQARQRGAYVILLSSGGKIQELAKADKVSFILVPGALPPRCALGYLSIIPLCILAKLGLIKAVDSSLRNTIKVLEDLRDNHLSLLVKNNIAQEIAVKLFNKLPFVYSSSIHFDVASTRLRGQLAENSKSLAVSNCFPEMNHNEIIGWHNPGKLLKDTAVVILRDAGAHPRVKKRMDITSEMIKKLDVPVYEIHSCGKDLLSRIFSLIYIGDFISYYLAIAYGIDPAPVDRITYLKNKLAEK